MYHCFVSAEAPVTDKRIDEDLEPVDPADPDGDPSPPSSPEFDPELTVRAVCSLIY